MTKGEALTLYRNLNQLGNLSGVKFSYAVARNLNLLKAEIESLEKSVELPEAFKAFDKERVALVEQYAEKDEKGKPKKEKAENGAEQYVMGQNEEEFKKEFDALKEKHKEAVELREKQFEEYTRLLTTDTDVSLYKIKLDMVPEGISARQMAGIYEIISED